MPPPQQSVSQLGIVGRRLRIAGLAVLLLLLAGGGLVFADWWTCLPEATEATYVGLDSCIRCHAQQHEQWQGSFHDKAMDLATPETVLGDFNDAEFTHFDIPSRMFRREGKYFINTEGPDGKLADFEIKYVFGVDPLQQYMVEFDRPANMPEKEIARVQVLRISWDTQNKRWFYLPPPDVADKLSPDDDLHWTGIAQRWNTMCADCHSTNLQKGFDTKTRTYHTTFSEINVSCEACHGPGSVHVELASAKSLFWDRKLGYGLAKLKDKARPETEIQTCAKCHSRRRVVHENFRPGRNFYDFYANDLLRDATYHADGQILDEVYEHGSFLQSKMYHKGIRCTDCHDPHTTRVKHDGNKLCTSCHAHSPGKFDSPSHHNHEPGSKGSLCVECHMPASTYMEVDPRRDHSLRVPRPDLSVKLGTPNACTGCHLNTPPRNLPPAEGQPELDPAKRAKFRQYNDWILAARDDAAVRAELTRLDTWARDHTKRWYGAKPFAPDHYAIALAAARTNAKDAENLLLALVRNRQAPAIARATALAHLAQFESPDCFAAARRSLTDPDPQLRSAALGFYEQELAQALAKDGGGSSTKFTAPLVKDLLPLLTDKTRLVRSETGRVLARLPSDKRGNILSGQERESLNAATEEFKAHLLAENDRSGAHMSLGVLYETLGKSMDAEAAYQTAIDVEPRTVGPRTNLAALCDHFAEQAEADATQASRVQDQEAVEKAVAEAQRRREQSARLRREELVYLARDARLAPTNADVQYRYGMSLYLHNQEPEAEAALKTAEQLSPDSTAPVLALALLYQKQMRWDEALRYAERVVKLSPRDPSYQQMLEEMKKQAEER